MRRYDDPVETRMGLVSGTEGPEQFLWRGRLWKVRAVLAHWVETGPWWQSGSARAVIGSDEPAGGPPGRSTRTDLRSADLLGERELWRVEAGRGAATGRTGGFGGGLGGGFGGGSDGPGGGPGGELGDGVPDVPVGGVFDLAFDWSDGRWALVGCMD